MTFQSIPSRAGALLLALALLPGCGPRPSQPVPSTPTPTPSPTPIFIPHKRMETSVLFNGVELHSTLASEPGTTATTERDIPGSYSLELTLKVKVPRANRDLASLSTLNEALPKLLPTLPTLMATARVAPSYEALYRRKLTLLQQDLARLDLLVSRHNFFDCETILELQAPATKRTAVLLQADMDVDTDGSDPDRLPSVDGNSATFQPMTSYRWPKRTPLENPFLPGRLTKLHGMESELAHAKAGKASSARLYALRDSIAAVKYEIHQLKTNSFLLAATDPYVVIPGTLNEGSTPAFSPHVGDYCAVIVGQVIYPAIVGDIGPSYKVGEASFRVARQVNPASSADVRAVTPLKATYLIFPNSADKPFGPPDLDRWHLRVDALLRELGGYTGVLFAWENLSRPAPLPTPTPSPTATPQATSPGSPSPKAVPSATGTTASPVLSNTPDA